MHMQRLTVTSGAAKALLTGANMVSCWLPPNRFCTPAACRPLAQHYHQRRNGVGDPDQVNIQCLDMHQETRLLLVTCICVLRQSSSPYARSSSAMTRDSFAFSDVIYLLYTKVMCDAHSYCQRYHLAPCCLTLPPSRVQ